jgi:hypothetical protein
MLQACGGMRLLLQLQYCSQGQESLGWARYLLLLAAGIAVSHSLQLPLMLAPAAATCLGSMC